MCREADPHSVPVLWVCTLHKCTQHKKIRRCTWNLVSLWSPSPSAAPPSGPCDLQCLHGGSCFLNARQVAKCRCQPSYTGERCEINQCRDYCKNGGTCTASHTGESPTCPQKDSQSHFLKVFVLFGAFSPVRSDFTYKALFKTAQLTKVL